MDERITGYRYAVVLEPDHEEPGRFNVRVPALPGCLTYGESIEDALENAREAITGYVAVLTEMGKIVPIEEHPVVATSIVVPVAAVSTPPNEARLPAEAIAS